MKKILGSMKKILKILCIIFILFIAITQILISYGARNSAQGNEEYMIIFGAQIIGDKPSLSLENRLNTGLEFWNKHKEISIIVSGGQGKDEIKSEAKLMKDYLIEHGVDETKILLEDKSKNTYENIKFSKSLMEDNDTKTIVVSNDYHLFRIKMIAKAQGIETESLAAKTPISTLVQSRFRESFAIVKSFIFDK